MSFFNGENQGGKLQSTITKWIMYLSYFRWYPDKFLDFISPENQKISLYFYQRIYLRIMMRYRKVFLTATRGTSKSYLQNLCFMLKCIFYPGIKLFICAPGKEQAAKISQDCIDDILDHYPLLKGEIRKYVKNKDYTKLIFHNGSKYDVVQMRDSARGGRRHGGAVEEISDAKFDGAILNAVVIPLMANDRQAANGKIDAHEIKKSELYITTAGTKQRFSHEKMTEVLQDMIKGKSAFCLGNSYELPCMYGQLDTDFIEELRESPTYALLDFMREYQSVWTGSSTGSLISEEKLQKSRIVGLAEWEHCGDPHCEYVLSYDVSRNEGEQNALSCLTVVKISRKNDGKFTKELVNIYSREGEHDTLQAKFLKQKVAEYKARILVVDANGIGSGVVDQLVLDLGDGYPPFSVVNDHNNAYEKFKTPDSIPMVFALKSQRTETRNSNMINNFMKVFNALDIGLLKVPHEGIKDVLKKYKIARNDTDKIAEWEVPYILTNNLCEEILNLEYKQQGMETCVKRVSTGIQKDKFSSLLYGLFWIYLEERKILEKQNQANKTIDIRAVKYRKANPYGRR